MNIKWAYLAGFLDGDGSIYVRIKPNKTYKFNFQISPSIVFFQSKKVIEKIEKLQKQYQIGYLRIRKDNIIEWIIGDELNIRLLLKNIMPFVRLKKAQDKLMLEILNDKKKIKDKDDFIKVAKKIEQFKDLNYSKKRKIRIY